MESVRQLRHVDEVYRMFWLYVWLFITTPYLRWLFPHLGFFGAGFAVLFNGALSFVGESGPIFPYGDVGMGPSATPPEYFHTFILVSNCRFCKSILRQNTGFSLTLSIQGIVGMVSTMVFGITFSVCRTSTPGKRFLAVATILIADSVILGFSIQWIKYIWSESSLYNDPLVTSGLHPDGVVWWLKLFKPMRKSFLSFV